MCPMNRRHFLLGIALALASAHAQTEFAAEQILFVNNPPLATRALDLDGDNDPDILIRGEAGLMVSLHTDGQGSFSPPRLIGDRRTQSEFLADLDGDLDLDILTAQVNGNTRPIAWHRNEGDGSYSSALSIRSENSSLNLFPPTDVDGDDDLDLIWYDGSSEIIEWMENTDGQGSFASPQTIQALENMLSASLVDLNGDLVPDFIGQDWKGTGLSSDDELVWIPGSLSGGLSFGTPQTLEAGATLQGVGDLNNDGRPDAIIQKGSALEIQWIRNDGSGSFAAPQTVFSYTNSVENLFVADFDNDTFGDVLFSLRFGDAFVSRYNDATDSFDPPVALASPTNTLFTGLSAGDLNGDTRTDLLTTVETEALLHRRNPGALTVEVPSTIHSAIEDLTDVASIDLDEDTDPDIVISSEDGKVLSLENLGAGQFGGAQQLFTGQTGLEVIHPAQIDGAGMTDLIALRRDQDRASWHAGSSGGFAAPSVIDDLGFQPAAVTTADFNDDGSLDLAIAFSGDEACAWYSQNPATHAFTYHQLNGTIEGTRAIASGDIDGDTFPDIVAAGFDGNVYLFSNTDGVGSFSNATLIGTGPAGLDDIALADLDGQNGLDIVVAEGSGVDTTVTAFFNDGSGGFSASSNLYTGGSGNRSMAVGDLDQDGDPDFVTTTASHTYWHENDGSGSFSTTSLPRASGSSPYTLKLVDLDQDGDLDILDVSRFDGLIGWFRNDWTPPPPNDDPITVWAWDRGITEPDVLDLGSDTDGDGATLLEEFAYNMDPLVPDSHPVPDNGQLGAPDFWFTFGFSYRARGRFVRHRDRAALGLQYIIETSPDLQTWTPYPGNVGTRSIDSSYQRITFNIRLANKPARHFTRIRLAYDPPATP